MIKTPPKLPGVYLFKKGKKILYAGKAANIKERLKYYEKITDTRLKKMVSESNKIDWLTTDSEIEALLLESQLIKKYKPPFNVMLRDDKQYFYVGFTREKFPKLIITHQPHQNPSTSRHHKGITFIGPFTDGTALKTTLRLLRKIFPYCTCKQQHNNFCLNYHIGKCPGYCCLKEDIKNKAKKNNYLKNTKALKSILEGKKSALLKNMEKEMGKFAKMENFEDAINLRDKAEKLQRVFENAKIIKELPAETDYELLHKIKEELKLNSIPKRIEGYDVSNIQGKFATASMVVFTNGMPDKKEYKKFRIKYTKAEPNDIAMLKETLIRRFRHPEWSLPDLLLIDGGKGQFNVANKIVRMKNPGIEIVSLAKGHSTSSGYKVFSDTLKKPRKIGKLSQGVRNLILNIDSEAHRFAIAHYRILHRKKLKEKKPAQLRRHITYK